MAWGFFVIAIGELKTSTPESSGQHIAGKIIHARSLKLDCVFNGAPKSDNSNDTEAKTQTTHRKQKRNRLQTFVHKNQPGTAPHSSDWSSEISAMGKEATQSPID